ncbi:MAG: HAMP domain-containing histidine kinase [Leptospirales bacterium]|nr:HAMP domain-containing histidine kinase [Leptospirales bacterium]
MEPGPWSEVGPGIAGGATALFEDAPLALYAIDASYRLQAINRAGRERLQPNGAGNTERCYHALYGRTQVCPYCPLLQETERKQLGERVLEKLISWRNTRREEKSLRLLFSPRADSEGLMEAVEDITAQQQSQEETLRKENLASLGIMISGIAHELNNPLTGMGLNLQNLAANLAAMAPDEIAKRLSILRKDLQQAARIVSDILSFSRPGNLRLAVADIREAVEQAQAKTRRLYPVLSRQTEWQNEGEGVAFPFDPEKIERLLINLYRNSLQAMDYAPGYIRTAVRQTRRSVQLIIQDNAGGIPADQLKHIFKPFFSNSRDGRGSGLGLTICHSIVREHSGRIHARSQSGQTRFYISLPMQHSAGQPP